jgi:hypothetical protein
VIKTKHTCRFGESGIGHTSGSQRFPEPTSLRSVSSGNFQPSSVRPIPDSPPCKYVSYRTKGSDFRTTVNRNIFVLDLCCPFAHAATNPIANHLNFEPCPKTFNRESRHFLYWRHMDLRQFGLQAVASIILLKLSEHLLHVLY